MKKLQKSKTKISTKPVKRPILRKLTKLPEKDLNRSNSIASPTSPLSAQLRFPDPITLDTLDTSMDYDSDQISKLTTDMRQQILSSLTAFKSVNQVYISKSNELESEVDSFQEQFSCMNSEIKQLLVESYKSKNELSRMKNIIESPKNRLSLDLSSVKLSKEDRLQEALKSLKLEITEIKSQVNLTESMVLQRESENCELREVVSRLKESFPVGDKRKVNASCASCDCVIS